MFRPAFFTSDLAKNTIRSQGAYLIQFPTISKILLPLMYLKRSLKLL